MDNNVSRILEGELGKLGATSAAVGSRVAKVFTHHIGSVTLNKVAGYLGASMVSKWLPSNEYEITKTIAMGPREFLTKATNVLTSQGRLLEDIGRDAEQATIGAVVGSGYMNMNPAVVLVSIDRVSENDISVTVRGYAKEGLIKQYGGEKAAKRIASLIL